MWVWSKGIKENSAVSVETKTIIKYLCCILVVLYGRIFESRDKMSVKDIHTGHPLEVARWADKPNYLWYVKRLGLEVSY